MRTERTSVLLALSCAAAFASAQGTEATSLNFVGTATGNGTLVGGAPWSFVGGSAQSFSKKSGGGSTGGGFSARSEPSWFAQSSASFHYSIDPDGVRFGTQLHVAGNLPFEFVTFGNVQASVAAEFDFTTDEILFYSGTYDPLGTVFSFSSTNTYSSPKLLFPGSHSVDVFARSIAESTHNQRVFDRTSAMSRFIKLTPLPTGYARIPGRAFGEFRNTGILLSKDGAAAHLAARTTQWWEPVPNFLRFLWRDHQQAAFTGAGSDEPVGLASFGDVVFLRDPDGRIIRAATSGTSTLTWPSEVVSTIFIGSSASGDVALVDIYDPNSTNYIGVWSQSAGISSGPWFPGLVHGAAWVSPVAISGDGQVIVARWGNQPEGQGLPSDGYYVARLDGSDAIDLGFVKPTAINHDGTVVAGQWADGNPALWLNGFVGTLPLPFDWTFCEPRFLSDDGSTIIGTAGENAWLVWTNANLVESLDEFLARRRINLSEVADSYPAGRLQVLGLSADGATIVLSLNVPGDDSFSYDTRVFVVRIPVLCPADLNLDRLVDDSDFVAFVAAYDALVCPDPSEGPCWADLNVDGYVNDDDFVLFAAAYNELLCPE